MRGVLCCAVLCCAVLCCAVLCCAVLRCAALRCAALRCVASDEGHLRLASTSVVVVPSAAVTLYLNRLTAVALYGLPRATTVYAEMHSREEAVHAPTWWQISKA